MQRHEDDRRVLTSIPYKEGEIKIITTKQDCELGNHYHKVKTETFRLLEGEASVYLEDCFFELQIGLPLKVDPEERHSFKIKKDSVLFCVCSHPYDENDDYV